MSSATRAAADLAWETSRINLAFSPEDAARLDLLGLAPRAAVNVLAFEGPDGFNGAGFASAVQLALLALDGVPGVNHEILAGKGFTAHEIAADEQALTGAGSLRAAFSPAVIGAGFVADVLGASDDAVTDPAFDTLAQAGFTAEDIAAAE